MIEPAPGDVLITRSKWWLMRFIRIGALLRGKPSQWDHVAVVHHKDAAGTWWAIEGRPGGVGWADASEYLASPYTTHNVYQPRTDAQREVIARGVEGMLGVEYDWSAIIENALMVARLEELWRARAWNHRVPGQMICSSLAAYWHREVGVDYPPYVEARFIAPWDWAMFVDERRYNKPR